MSGPNLATTLFQTGPKDDLAVVDVYSVTDTKVKTSLMDRFQNTAGNIVNKIVANPDLLATVASSLMNNNGSVAFSKEDLLDALSSTSMGYKGRSMVSDLSSGLSDKIGNTLARLTGDPRKSYGIMTQIKSGIDTVVDTMTYDDLSSSQNITSYLANLTGQLDIGRTVGLDAEAATLVTFLTEAIGVGSYGAFETMIDAYSGREDYNMVVRGVLSHSFEQAAASGNLKMIEKMVDKIGGRAILAQTPAAIYIVISNYRFPKKIKSKDYLEQLDKLKTVLGKIDPNWETSIRTVVTAVANENVYTDQECQRIDIFENASVDSRQLFMLDADNKIDMMIAKSYPKIDCIDSNRTKYPKVYY